MNGTNIEISIIIPVYQAEKRLRDCFESVKKAVDFISKNEELGKPVAEIILVDDGSTDSGKSMCDGFLAENVVVRHTKNYGVSHARNVGIELSSGKYLTFVDSDDTVEENYLDRLYREAVFSGLPVIDMFDSVTDGSMFNGIDYIENVILNKNTHVWGKLFKKENIIKNKVAFPEGLAIGEDMLFLLDMALAHGKTMFSKIISEGGYNYYDNESGAMNSDFKESYDHQIICWRKAEERLSASDYDFSENVLDRLGVIQVMNSLLVVGKIACMDKQLREKADIAMLSAVLGDCRESIDRALQRKHVFSKLSIGYKVKVVVFRISKNLYLRLYGMFKGK